MKIINVRTLKLLLPFFLCSILLCSCSDELTPAEDNSVVVNAPLFFQVTHISANEKLLTWIDNSKLEEGYVIEKSINDPNNFEKFAVLPPNSVSFMDTTVVSDTTSVIFYRLYAFKEDLKSKSVKVSFRNSLSAPSRLTFVHVADKSIKLNWQDNSTLETGFLVERQSPGGTFEKIARLSPNTTSFTDVNLDTAKSYIYRVAALMNSEISGYSNTLEIEYNLEFESIRTVEDSYGVQASYLIPNTSYIALVFGTPYIQTATRPMRLITRDGSFVREIPDRNMVVSVSSSGKTIVTSATGGNINVWDVETGTLKKVIKRKDASMPVDAIAISPQENLIAVSQHISSTNSNGNIDVFDISDGSLKWSRNIVPFYNRSMQFSNDGSRLLFIEMNMGTSYLDLNSVNTADGGGLKRVFSRQFIRWTILSPSGKYILISNSDGTTSQYYLVDLTSGAGTGTLLNIDAGEWISDAYIVENNKGETYVNSSRFKASEFTNNMKSWRVSIGENETPVVSSAFSNIKLFPGNNSYLLGHGAYTEARILKFIKRWTAASN